MSSVLPAVELVVLSGQLRAPVASSQGTHFDRAVLFVKVTTPEGHGWGESGVLSLSHGEVSLHELAFFLSGPGVERLGRAVRARDGELPLASTISMLFGTDPCSRAAAAVLEMAVSDLELRTRAHSLAATLGFEQATVPVGGLIQWAHGASVEAICDEADRLIEAGCRRLRLKVLPGFDHIVARAVVERAGATEVWADCNGGYDQSDDPRFGLPALLRLDEVGLSCIEQPLTRADLVGHVGLREQLATPIGLDETLASERAVRDAIRYGACDVFCVKPTRLGGIAATRAAIFNIEANGGEVFVGGMFETGFARATLVQLAGLTSGARASDLTAPSSYGDLPDFEYPRVNDGYLLVPRGPGVAGSPVAIDDYLALNPDRVVSRKVIGSEPMFGGVIEP